MRNSGPQLKDFAACVAFGVILSHQSFTTSEVEDHDGDHMEQSFGYELSPQCLTILATYKCSAQCRECCFESSPHLTERLSLRQILHRIDQAHQAFPLLRLVCFSGGECFLLGEDLISAVAYASSLGFVTRCVSNGYWAVTLERAMAKMASLTAAGLQELNISTGDEHQQYVPFEVVLNGAFAAALNGVSTIVINEGSQEARFRRADMLKHPRVVSFSGSMPLLL